MAIGTGSFKFQLCHWEEKGDAIYTRLPEIVFFQGLCIEVESYGIQFQPRVPVVVVASYNTSFVSPLLEVLLQYYFLQHSSTAVFNAAPCSNGHSVVLVEDD